jgi:hypothetical protein
MRKLVSDIRSRGETINVYGASTKGKPSCSTGHWFHADLSCGGWNPDKWGSLTIGTHILILTEEDSRALRPDHYLVPPWHFLSDSLEREREYVAGGGKFIVPLSEVRLIDAGV